VNTRSRRAIVLATLTVLALVSATWASTVYGKAKPHQSRAKPHQARVIVTESEWRITLSRSSVSAGPVTFVIRDHGKLAHELIILRTQRPADKLPMRGKEVDLKAAGSVVGKIVTVEPGKEASVTVRLEKGRYVLLCNLPAHYKQGQFAAFDVT